MGRLECMVIEKIISSTFPDEIIDTYNEQYHDCITAFIKKNVDEGVFAKEDGQKLFEANKNQRVRQQLLKIILERQSALFNMGPANVSKKEKNSETPGAHLVNEREKYVFGLCNTAHKDGKGQIRKYLFHETCPVFKNYSAASALLCQSIKSHAIYAGQVQVQTLYGGRRQCKRHCPNILSST